MNWRRLVAAGAVAALGMLSVGCASKQAALLNGRLTSLEMIRKRPADAEYVVEPPDVIKVEALDEPALTRSVQLRQDGMIVLPLLEEVHVAGMTTAQIRQKLEDLYSTYYKEPQLLVTVEAYRSKHITVYGEVRRQGAQAYTGYQTVADAVGQAGGVTWRSAPTRVRVIRGDPDAPEIYKVNLKKLLLKGDTRQDVSLAENDVVYVPPNLLAWLAYQIDNILFPFRGALSAVGSAESLSQ
jgi:polysaccharide export outer membrane protein